jgi:hypothetical protein
MNDNNKITKNENYYISPTTAKIINNLNGEKVQKEAEKVQKEGEKKVQEESENVEEIKSSKVVRNETIHWMSDTSTHGFAWIVKSRHLFLKLIWTIILVGSASYCFYGNLNQISTLK